MKRRTFIQWLAALPFFPKSKSKANEIPKDLLLNGTVWKAPWPLCHTVVILFLEVREGVATYCLLSSPYQASGREGTATMVCRYDDTTSVGRYSGIYTESELLHKLTKEIWKHCPELELRLFNRDTG